MDASSSTTTCTNTNLSLINYLSELDPSGVGVISYSNIAICDSRLGYRVWTFTFRGTVSVGKFTQTFYFDPKCQIPNGNDVLTLDQINFNYVVEEGPPKKLKKEPVSGTMIVNNKVIGVTNCPRLINFRYDPKKAIFTLNIDVTGCVKVKKENEIYVNIWIKDASGLCQPNCNNTCSTPSWHIQFCCSCNL